MARIDIQIDSQPLSSTRCIDFVMEPGAGGIVTFTGAVRNQTQGKEVVRLEFEAYEPMAIKEMDKIARDVAKRWKALAVSIHHRVGSLAIGELPVVISVSAPHRQAAFEACQYAIDTLKETVPIWKKEIFSDGEVWVAAHP